MLSGRISDNICENIFQSYTGTTSENTYFLLTRLIAHASKSDGNMMSFTLTFLALDIIL